MVLQFTMWCLSSVSVHWVLAWLVQFCYIMRIYAHISNYCVLQDERSNPLCHRHGCLEVRCLSSLQILDDWTKFAQKLMTNVLYLKSLSSISEQILVQSSDISSTVEWSSLFVGDWCLWISWVTLTTQIYVPMNY